MGFRFDRALFKSHPEFNGEVRASVIAPGHLLVSAETSEAGREREDPVVGAFLAFLAQDMQRAPQDIKPFPRDLAQRMAALVKGVKVSLAEDLGDEDLL